MYTCTSDSRSALKAHNLCSRMSLASFFFIDDNVFSLMSRTMLFTYHSYIPVMTTQTSTTCTMQYQFYVGSVSHISSKLTPMLILIEERVFIFRFVIISQNSNQELCSQPRLFLSIVHFEFKELLRKSLTMVPFQSALHDSGNDKMSPAETAPLPLIPID